MTYSAAKFDVVIKKIGWPTSCDNVLTINDIIRAIADSGEDLEYIRVSRREDIREIRYTRYINEIRQDDFWVESMGEDAE